MSLGIGIISFAHGHVGAYLKQIKNMTDARVVAAWDDDAARGNKICSENGVEFTAKLPDLLARKDISAVLIASETSKHAEHAVAAAQAGKDIVLQKPMALSLEDCDRIRAAVKEGGVKFSMAWQMRCDPQNQWMRQQVWSGALGKLTLVRRRHGLPTQLWGDNFTTTWHVKRELNLGMFMDDASHAADWLLWMFGKPESVTAEIETIVNEKVPDDTGAAIYKFPGGMLGILECPFACAAAEDTTSIYGAKGTILQSWGDLPSCSNPPPPEGARGLKIFMAGEKQWTTVDILSPKSHGERIAGVARPAVEFLLGKREPIATAEEGRISTQMILGAYQSAKEGKRIKL
jgi:predicted dehydrogenase